MLSSIFALLICAFVFVLARRYAVWPGDPLLRLARLAVAAAAVVAIWIAVGALWPDRPALRAVPTLPSIVDTKHLGSAGPLRCLSVRELVARATRAATAQQPLDDDVAGMAGIGLIEAVLVDRAGGDLVLVGRLSTGGITFGDLIAAVENVWAPERGDTPIAPACSLEAEDANVARLRAFQESFDGDLTSAAQLDAYLQRIRELLGGQRVDIYGTGINRDSAWSISMVGSDYSMKAVSCSLVRIEGIPSMLDIGALPEFAGLPQAGVFSRLWFRVHAEDPRFLAASDAVVIDRCRVILKDQVQQADGDGALRDATGVVDPVARAFSAAFTSGFAKARAADSVYAGLENRYRLLAICHAIRAKDLLATAGLTVDSIVALRPRYEPSMPDALPPLANASQQRQGDGGAIAVTTRIAVGGVDMDLGFDPSMIDVTKTSTRVLTDFTERALRERPHPRALWWDLPPDVTLAGLRRKDA